MNTPELYELRMMGHLSKSWTARFEGLSMRCAPNGDTVLSGMLGQAALHGVLTKNRDLGLKLVTVNHIGSTDHHMISSRQWASRSLLMLRVLSS